MRYKFYDKVMVFLTGGIIAFNLCGCSRKSSSSTDSGVIIDSVTPSTEVMTSASGTLGTTIISTALTVTNSVTTTSLVTTEGTLSIYSEKDVVVLSRFEELGSDIKRSFDGSDFLDKGKTYFIYCVDFLFYDSEIKGVKFSELSDMAKQQLISDIITIDDLICSKFPNYKETISDVSSSAYNKASDIIHSGATSIRDYSREKLGEDNYMKIKEYKDLFIEQSGQGWDEFVDLVGNGYDKGKAKVKEWYENFRGQ